MSIRYAFSVMIIPMQESFQDEDIQNTNFNCANNEYSGLLGLITSG